MKYLIILTVAVFMISCSSKDEINILGFFTFDHLKKTTSSYRFDLYFSTCHFMVYSQTTPPTRIPFRMIGSANSMRWAIFCL